MLAKPREVLSFGGVPLQGDNLVRLTFLDEAGISNREEEPIVVIGGIIVHGDFQYKSLRSPVQQVIDNYIPIYDREGFVFHAAELFSGGKYFDRHLWPLCVRWKILEELASIPQELDLPVIFGFQERTKVPGEIDGQLVKDNMHTAACQLLAFSHCLIGIERWMRRDTDNEVTMLIAEDKPEVKQAFKAIHRICQREDRIIRYMPQKFRASPELPVTRIIDDIHFTDKLGSVPLSNC